jgi:hypothetical protein
MDVSIVQEQDVVSAFPEIMFCRTRQIFAIKSMQLCQPREFKYPTGPQLVSDSRGATQISGQEGQRNEVPRMHRACRSVRILTRGCCFKYAMYRLARGKIMKLYRSYYPNTLVMEQGIGRWAYVHRLQISSSFFTLSLTSDAKPLSTFTCDPELS